MTMPTRPYRCLHVHTIGDKAEDCIRELERVLDDLKNGNNNFSKAAEVTWNHGGGGGP